LGAHRRNSVREEAALDGSRRKSGRRRWNQATLYSERIRAPQQDLPHAMRIRAQARKQGIFRYCQNGERNRGYASCTIPALVSDEVFINYGGRRVENARCQTTSIQRTPQLRQSLS
jgi:hypothetical protein